MVSDLSLISTFCKCPFKSRSTPAEQNPPCESEELSYLHPVNLTRFPVTSTVNPLEIVSVAFDGCPRWLFLYTYISMKKKQQINLENGGKCRLLGFGLKQKEQLQGVVRVPEENG